MFPLVLAAAVLLHQQVPQRPAQSSASRDSAVTGSRQAIVDVGRSVAEMRSAHDALRRAAFNSSDAVVVERAQELRQRCRDLTTVARATPGRLCRTCFSAAAQRAVNGYRAILPGVSQVGTRCASQLAQSIGTRTPAASVRRDIWAVGRTTVEGLFPYEARLRDVRRAFGIESPPPPAPRR
jgi:hypothetical protein